MISDKFTKFNQKLLDKLGKRGHGFTIGEIQTDFF